MGQLIQPLTCPVKQLTTSKLRISNHNHNPAQLVCTGLGEPGADPIWTRSLFHLHLPQLISHLERREGQSGAGGLSVRCGGRVNVRGVHPGPERVLGELWRRF